MSKPVLYRIDEFKQILSKYQVSTKGKEILSQIDLVLLRAPSAGGRNTIIRELVKTGQYEEFVTDTTRPPRSNDGLLEQDGVEYWFRSEDELLSDLQAGKFVEAEVIHGQQVSGMSIRELERAKTHGKISISDIHFEGVENVLAAKPDTHVIFITPPTYKEWLKRLKYRGDMTDEEFNNRFMSAKEDYEHALSHEYYSFVINDSYLLSADHIRHIVETKDYPKGANAEAREVAEQVLDEINKELNK